MKAVEFVRNHLAFLGWHNLSVEKRRELANKVKAARKRGQNPGAVLASECARISKKSA